MIKTYVKNNAASWSIKVILDCSSYSNSGVTYSLNRLLHVNVTRRNTARLYWKYYSFTCSWIEKKQLNRI